MFNYIKRIL